jgi:hypothetical protein
MCSVLDPGRDVDAGALLLAAEAVWGQEQSVSFRRRHPDEDPAVEGQTVHGRASFLTHYDFLDALGASLRYGYSRTTTGPDRHCPDA